MSTEVIRRKTTANLLGEGQSKSRGSGTYAPYVLEGNPSSETCLSFSHTIRNGVWSGGGPFTVKRKSYHYTVAPSKHSFVLGDVMCLGAASLWAGRPSVPETPSDSELDADGTTAIARTEPTDPVFGMTTALGEIITGGLPAIPTQATKEQVRRANKAGSEYLNAEFGWAPLVNDLRTFAYAVNESDKIIQNYKKGSGIWLKRSYMFPEEVESADTAIGVNVKPAVSALGPYQGHEFCQISRRKWFEGAFMYHVPSPSTQLGKISYYGSLARKLLGVEITPEVAWNLAPWSWAADWFGNAGDVMHNVSALGRDGLVMRYGYMMCHTRRMRVVSATSEWIHGQATMTEVEETKLRRPATPYGFGVNFDSLSASQVAVIAALGLSRW